jgi:hypothetical protein
VLETDLPAEGSWPRAISGTLSPITLRAASPSAMALLVVVIDLSRDFHVRDLEGNRITFGPTFE